MLIPGNTWQQVWDTARAQPARRQKRLFDDTREAEKILHFFETQTIGQIVRLTVAPLFHTAIAAMAATRETDGRVRVAQFDALHGRLVGQVCKLSREPWTDQTKAGTGGRTAQHSSQRWEHLIGEMQQLELLAARSRSLVDKLFGGETAAISESDDHLLAELLAGRDAALQDGAKGAVSQRIVAMFAEAKRQADAPFGDEEPQTIGPEQMVS